MDFYHWGYGMRRGALGVALLDGDKDGLLRGERRPVAPVPTKHLVGRRVGDILWAEIYPVVSEGVVHALDESGLTGWATYPVVLRGEDGEVVPGFHGWRWWGGVDQSTSTSRGRSLSTTSSTGKGCPRTTRPGTGRTSSWRPTARLDSSS
jgi:hypothetical protein